VAWDCGRRGWRRSDSRRSGDGRDPGREPGRSSKKRDDATSAAAAADAARVARLDLHYSTYQNLGDLPRRAQAFIGGADEGSAADVRDVARRLRALVDDIAMRRIDAAATARYFGGRLRGWASSLREIGNSTSGRFIQFSAAERADYLTLADAVDMIQGAQARRAEEVEAAAASAAEAMNSAGAAENEALPE
jgi:hypothetical protein